MVSEHAEKTAGVAVAAETFKALGDEKRLHIMHRIAVAPGICSCKLLEDYDMSQSTLSHHMKLLCSARLVNCEKKGRWVHYTLNEDGIARAMEELGALAAVAGAVDDEALHAIDSPVGSVKRQRVSASQEKD